MNAPRRQSTLSTLIMRPNNVNFAKPAPVTSDVLECPLGHLTIVGSSKACLKTPRRKHVPLILLHGQALTLCTFGTSHTFFLFTPFHPPLQIRCFCLSINYRFKQRPLSTIDLRIHYSTPRTCLKASRNRRTSFDLIELPNKTYPYGTSLQQQHM